MDAGRKRRLTGTALAGVMWLLVLMMAILAVGAQNSRLDTRTSLSSVEKIRCRWLCRAGEETALAYLKDDMKDVDSLLDDWAVSNEDLQNVQLTNGTYTVTITDECSKLNLNTASANQLLNLDTQGMNETITDSVLDWRDSDDDVRTSGAESGYYLNLPIGYPCHNGNFRTPREVLRVRGVTEDLFYGKDNRILGQGGWSRFLTCYSTAKNVDASGNARININSASESDLTGKLSLSAVQVRYIIQNRPFQNLAGLLGIRSANSSSQSSSGSSQSGNVSQSGNASQGDTSQGGNTSGRDNSGRNNSGDSQTNQTAPQSFNTPAEAPLPARWPGVSTVAALLAADGEPSGTEPPPPPPGDEQGPPPGEGRGERRGTGQGQGRGRGRGVGPRGFSRPSGQRRGGAGQPGREVQAQPLDWATFSRIFDQITLTDNTMITGQININTVGVEVLRAFLEGNEDLTNKIIAYRNSQGGEITNVCDLIKIDGMTQQTLAPYLDQFCMRSSVYMIRVMAQSSSCGVHYFMEEVVNRDREGREALYRLEGVGN